MARRQVGEGLQIVMVVRVAKGPPLGLLPMVQQVLTLQEIILLQTGISHLETTPLLQEAFSAASSTTYLATMDVHHPRAIASKHGEVREVAEAAMTGTIFLAAGTIHFDANTPAPAHRQRDPFFPVSRSRNPGFRFFTSMIRISYIGKHGKGTDGTVLCIVGEYVYSAIVFAPTAMYPHISSTKSLYNHMYCNWKANIIPAEKADRTIVIDP